MSYRARLAQSVEHGTLNPRVVGSSPTLGLIFFLVCFSNNFGILPFFRNEDFTFLPRHRLTLFHVVRMARDSSISSHERRVCTFHGTIARLQNIINFPTFVGIKLQGNEVSENTFHDAVYFYRKVLAGGY